MVQHATPRRLTFEQAKPKPRAFTFEQASAKVELEEPAQRRETEALFPAPQRGAPDPSAPAPRPAPAPRTESDQLLDLLGGIRRDLVEIPPGSVARSPVALGDTPRAGPALPPGFAAQREPPSADLLAPFNASESTRLRLREMREQGNLGDEQYARALGRLEAEDRRRMDTRAVDEFIGGTVEGRMVIAPVRRVAGVTTLFMANTLAVARDVVGVSLGRLPGEDAVQPGVPEEWLRAYALEQFDRATEIPEPENLLEQVFAGGVEATGIVSQIMALGWVTGLSGPALGALHGFISGGHDLEGNFDPQSAAVGAASGGLMFKALGAATKLPAPLRMPAGGVVFGAFDPVIQGARGLAGLPFETPEVRRVAADTLVGLALTAGSAKAVRVQTDVARSLVEGGMPRAEARTVARELMGTLETLAKLPPEPPPTIGRHQLGHSTEILFPGGGRMEARYALVESAELQPSHHADTFSPRRSYPPGAQERAYHTVKEEQAKVRRIEDKWDSRFLYTDTPTALDGPPVATAQTLRLLAGNARTMGSQRRGARDPETLRRAAVENAERFGFSRAEAARMEAPLIVRLVDEVSAAEFPVLVRRFNETFTQAVSEADLGVSRAKTSRRSLAALAVRADKLGPDQTIREAIRTDRAFVQALEADGIIRKETRNTFVAAETGHLTEMGVLLAENMLLGKVLADGDLIRAVPPTTKQQLLRVMPAIIAAEDSAPGVLRPLVEAAVRSEVRRAASGDRLEDFIAQKSMTPAPSQSDPRIAQLHRALVGLKPTDMAKAFRQYAAEIVESTSPQAMIGGLKRTPDQVFERAFGKLELGTLTSPRELSKEPPAPPEVTAAIRLEDGRVFEGRHHGEAIVRAELYVKPEVGESFVQLPKFESGFVDRATGEWLTREQATKRVGLEGKLPHARAALTAQDLPEGRQARLEAEGREPPRQAKPGTLEPAAVGWINSQKGKQGLTPRLAAALDKSGARWNLTRTLQRKVTPRIRPDRQHKEFRELETGTARELDVLRNQGIIEMSHTPKGEPRWRLARVPAQTRTAASRVSPRSARSESEGGGLSSIEIKVRSPASKGSQPADPPQTSRIVRPSSATSRSSVPPSEKGPARSLRLGAIEESSGKVIVQTSGDAVELVRRATAAEGPLRSLIEQTIRRSVARASFVASRVKKLASIASKTGGRGKGERGIETLGDLLGTRVSFERTEGMDGFVAEFQKAGVRILEDTSSLQDTPDPSGPGGGSAYRARHLLAHMPKEDITVEIQLHVPEILRQVDPMHKHYDQLKVEGLDPAVVERINREVRDVFDGEWANYKTRIANPPAHRPGEAPVVRSLGFDPIRVRGPPEGPPGIITRSARTSGAKAGAQHQPRRRGAPQPKGVGIAETEPLRREAILSDLSVALDVPFFQGRVKGKGRMGFFREPIEEVRLKNRSDVETAAHEIAHLLSFRNKELRRAWSGKDGRPLRAELRSVSYDKKSTEEGFGEFLRLWMTQGTKAEQLTPRAVQWFESWMDVQPAKVKDGLRAAREGMHAWFQQNALERARSNVGFEQVINEGRYRSLNAFRQWALDDVDGFRRMEMDLAGSQQFLGPYALARMTRGKQSIIEGALELGAPVARPDGSHTFRGKSLVKALSPVAGELESYLLYAAGRRAQKLRAEGRERNFTKDQIDAMVGLEKPLFEQTLADYQEFNQAVLDFAEAKGIIDPAARAKFDSQTYIPFYREAKGPPAGSGSPAGGRPEGMFGGIRRLTGGTGNVRDLLQNMVDSTAMLIDSALTNEVRLRAVDFAMSQPGGARFLAKIGPDSAKVKLFKADVRRGMEDRLKAQGVPEMDRASILDQALQGPGEVLDFWRHGQTPKGDNLVAAYRDGKAEYYEVADPILFRSFQALNRPGKGDILQFLSFFRRVGQTTITLDPTFFAANMVRDTLMSSVMTSHGFKPMVDSLRGLTSRTLKDPAYREYIANGGGFASYLREEGAMQARLDRFYHQRGINPRNVLDTPKRVFAALERVSEAVEMSSRLGEFKRAVAEGVHPREAALEGREITTDFAMRGDSQFLGTMYDSIMFLKAGINGMDRLARGLYRDQNRVAVASKIGLIALASAGLYSFNRGLPEYDELEPWDKDVNWHFFIPTAASIQAMSDGTPPPPRGERYTHLRLPRLWETGAMARIAELSFEKAVNEEYGAGAFAGDAGVVVREMFRMNVFPQLVQPLAEQFANRITFIDRPIVSPRLQGLEKFARAEPSTSSTLRALGEATRGFPSALQIEPVRVEALLRGYFNAHAVYGLMLTDALLFDDGVDMRADQYPVLRRFYQESPTRHSRFVTEFYDTLQEATATRRTLRHFALQHRPDLVLELEQKRTLMLAPMMTRAAQSMSGYSRLRSMLRSAPDVEAVREIARNSAPGFLRKGKAMRAKALEAELRKEGVWDDRGALALALDKRLNAAQNQHAERVMGEVERITKEEATP